MAELSDTTKTLVAEHERWLRLAGTDLRVYLEGICHASVCTSLDDEQADAMMANRPCGTSGGWRRAQAADAVPCRTEPDTRRHIRYEV